MRGKIGMIKVRVIVTLTIVGEKGVWSSLAGECQSDYQTWAFCILSIKQLKKKKSMLPNYNHLWLVNENEGLLALKTLIKLNYL